MSNTPPESPVKKTSPKRKAPDLNSTLGLTPDPKDPSTPSSSSAFMREALMPLELFPSQAVSPPRGPTDTPRYNHLLSRPFSHMVTTVPCNKFLERIQKTIKNKRLKEEIVLIFSRINYVVTRRTTENQDVSIVSALVREQRDGKGILSRNHKEIYHSEKSVDIFNDIGKVADSIADFLDLGNREFVPEEDLLLHDIYNYLMIYLDIIAHVYSSASEESCSKISPKKLEGLNQHTIDQEIVNGQLVAKPEDSKLIESIHGPILEKTPPRLSAQVLKNVERLREGAGAIIRQKHAADADALDFLVDEVKRQRIERLSEGLLALQEDSDDDQGLGAELERKLGW